MRNLRVEIPGSPICGSHLLSDRIPWRRLGSGRVIPLVKPRIGISAPFRLPKILMEGHKIPIPLLDPGQEYPFNASVTMGVAPSVGVRLTWEKETGQREKVLTLSYL